MTARQLEQARREIRSLLLFAVVPLALSYALLRRWRFT